MNKKEAIEKAINVIGTQTELAELLTARTGITINQQRVSHWVKKGYLTTPMLAIHIEALTAQKNDQVDKHFLCPEFYPAQDSAA